MPLVKSAVTAPNCLPPLPLTYKARVFLCIFGFVFWNILQSFAATKHFLGEKSRVWGFFVFYHFGYWTIKTEVTKSFSLEGQGVDIERCGDLMCCCSSLCKPWPESHISQPGFPTDCRLPKHFNQSEL